MCARVTGLANGLGISESAEIVRWCEEVESEGCPLTAELCSRFKEIDCYIIAVNDPGRKSLN